MSPASKSFTYEVALTWRGERAAALSAGDRPEIVAAPPEDFPGADPAGWSPEHLFLGALDSCMMLSFLAHAEHRGVEVRGYRADASGTVRRREDDGRYAFVTVRLAPTVTVAPGQEEAARALTPKAERDCFISASTSAEIEVAWTVEAEPA